MYFLPCRVKVRMQRWGAGGAAESEEGDAEVHAGLGGVFDRHGMRGPKRGATLPTWILADEAKDAIALICQQPPLRRWDAPLTTEQERWGRAAARTLPTMVGTGCRPSVTTPRVGGIGSTRKRAAAKTRWSCTCRRRRQESLSLHCFAAPGPRRRSQDPMEPRDLVSYAYSGGEAVFVPRRPCAFGASASSRRGGRQLFPTGGSPLSGTRRTDGAARQRGPYPRW